MFVLHFIGMDRQIMIDRDRQKTVHWHNGSAAVKASPE